MAVKAKIGPQDHGRQMSLRAFEFAETEEGNLYELARGFIVVSGVPNYSHAAQIDVIEDELRFYRRAHRDAIHMILNGMNCKLVMPVWQSERHPDLAIYFSEPNGPKDAKLWRIWLPDILIEVVSPRSRDRDYVEKREEYWTLGAKEYWIVDAEMGKIMTLRRGRTDWIEKELFADDFCGTKLLPGFKLACKAIFDAAGHDAEDDE